MTDQFNIRHGQICGRRCYVVYHNVALRTEKRYNGICIGIREPMFPTSHTYFVLVYFPETTSVSLELMEHVLFDLERPVSISAMLMSIPLIRNNYDHISR